MNVSSLVERSAHGDTAAFRLLIDRYQRMVFSFLSKFLFQAQILEDLAQETFLRAYRHIADFNVEKGASFSTWLITIARNLAINEKAKNKRDRKHPSRYLDMHQAFSKENPQKILEKDKLNFQVHNAINQLPEKFHTAVILSYFDELSIEEIAQIEKCPVGTVKSRIFRGKQILRQNHGKGECAMKNSHRPCRLIQEDIACNRELRQDDKQHVLDCSACSAAAAKFKELDSLVRNVLYQEAPPNFADRVVAKILAEEIRSDNFIPQPPPPLLERTFYSKAVQWLLVGIGSVFSLFKILRFFSPV